MSQLLFPIFRQHLGMSWGPGSQSGCLDQLHASRCVFVLVLGLCIHAWGFGLVLATHDVCIHLVLLLTLLFRRLFALFCGSGTYVGHVCSGHCWAVQHLQMKCLRVPSCLVPSYRGLLYL